MFYTFLRAFVYVTRVLVVQNCEGVGTSVVHIAVRQVLWTAVRSKNGTSLVHRSPLHNMDVQHVRLPCV